MSLWVSISFRFLPFLSISLHFFPGSFLFFPFLFVSFHFIAFCFHWFPTVSISFLSSIVCQDKSKKTMFRFSADISISSSSGAQRNDPDFDCSEDDWKTDWFWNVASANQYSPLNDTWSDGDPASRLLSALPRFKEVTNCPERSYVFGELTPSYSCLLCFSVTHSDTQKHIEIHVNTHWHTDLHRDTETHTKRDTERFRDTHRDTQGHPETHRETRRLIETFTDTETHTHSKAVNQELG